jgi:hypothetical protein
MLLYIATFWAQAENIWKEDVGGQARHRYKKGT